MKMENFKPDNTETQKEVISDAQKERSNLAKHARRILLATGVAMSALFPNKTEAQTVKDKELITVNDTKDTIISAENKVGKTPKIYTNLKEYKEARQRYEDMLFMYTETQRFAEVYKKRYSKYGIDRIIPYKEAMLGRKMPNGGTSSRTEFEYMNLAAHLYSSNSSTNNDLDKKMFEFFRLSSVYPIALMAQGLSDKGIFYNIYPICEKPQEVVYVAPKPLGIFNIQGREFKYYSEAQLNEIKAKLETYNISPTKVGDSNNYTVSRFDEKSNGWEGNKLIKIFITKDADTKEDKVEKITLINLEDYK